MFSHICSVCSRNEGSRVELYLVLSMTHDRIHSPVVSAQYRLHPRRGLIITGANFSFVVFVVETDDITKSLVFLSRFLTLGFILNW